MVPPQNIVNQKKAEETVAQQALDVGKPTKASGLAQPAAAGDKRRNRWDQTAPVECVCSSWPACQAALASVFGLALATASGVYKCS